MYGKYRYAWIVEAVFEYEAGSEGYQEIISVNEYMDNGSGENVAFVEINDLPEYKMCFLKKGITTDDDEIFQKVIENGKNYYTYFAMVVNGEEKLYVKNLEEAEAVLQELKDKDSANKDNITIEEKYNTELATLVAREDAVNQLYEEKQVESKVMVASTSTNRKTSNRVSTSTKSFKRKSKFRHNINRTSKWNNNCKIWRKK